MSDLDTDAGPRVEAVTFDFWNTLCAAPTIEQTTVSRLGRLRETLASAGATVLDDELSSALVEVRRVFDENWKANQQYTHEEGVALLLKMLQVDLEEVHLERFTRSFTGASSSDTPDVTPNVGDTLRALKAGGVRLGIICDVGLSPSTVLRRHLSDHGLLDLFDHFSFSDEVGWYKPAREIFEHALDGLHASADRAAHIGDLRRTDVAGAQAVGMIAIRYRGAYDDSDAEHAGVEGDHVIDDHAELPALLGL